MKTLAFPNSRLAVLLAVAIAFTTSHLAAQTASHEAKSQSARRANVYLIDLPTALRLAGAQNLDIQLAREKVAEAHANHDSAIERFFPWLSPGVAFRGHDNLIQATEGNVIDVHKKSYAPGLTLTIQTDIGDAIFKAIEARQLLNASDHALDAQREETIAAAAQGYLDLVKAKSAVGVAAEAVTISDEYERQIDRAVEAGIAFKGDALRVKVQHERDRLALRRAQEERTTASARLARILHLEPGVELDARESTPAPLSLASAREPALRLIEEAFAARPEIEQSAALVLAAREAKNGAVYGPMIPTLGAQAFAGHFGGGRSGQPGRFGESEDYAASLSWRVGPGGLFDVGQIRAKQSRMRAAALDAEKVRDRIAFEIVTSRERVLSLADQLATAKQALADAEQSLRLDRERKEFGVGVVLETIVAEQELTRARNDYLATVAEYDKAQYSLLAALGRLSPAPSEETRSRAQRPARTKP
jgi:outer membrane protein TolC